MDDVRERVSEGGIPVVLQIVYVHVPVAEAAAGRKVEVTNDLVDAEATLDAAAFGALLIQLLGIVFAQALLHALAPTEGPGGLGICFADFVARIAAAGFNGVAWGVRSVAGSAVVGVEVASRLFARMPSTESVHGSHRRRAEMVQLTETVPGNRSRHHLRSSAAA